MKMVAYVIGIYLSVWAIRKRNEIDYKLDVMTRYFGLGLLLSGSVWRLSPVHLEAR